MKRLLLLFLPLLLLACLPAGAASAIRTTLTVTVTNAPVTSNTITINGQTRTWTNTSSSTYISTNLVGAGPSATNFANNLASFPLTGPFSFKWVTTNSFTLAGPIGGTISYASVGTWVTLSTNIQAAPETFTALWPIENIGGNATNRTNQASSFAYGMSTFSTQALIAGSSLVSNLVQVVSNQTVAGNKTFTGTNAFAEGGWNHGKFTNVASLSGVVTALTNGFWTNGVLQNPSITNGANFGKAFRSAGSGANSEQFGSNAVASGYYALAIGSEATASGIVSAAFGQGAQALGVQSLAIGSGAVAQETNDLAIGQNSEAIGKWSIAIGTSASAAGSNNVVIGAGATSTVDNEITLGTSAHTTAIAGLLTVSGSQSNTTFRGTNIINGRVDFKSRANTSPANGNNAGVILGTNVYVRISGPTTIGAYNGFAAEQDGSFHIVEFTGAVTNTISHQSGSDPTAANRIVTGTGADVSFTNNPTVIMLIYDTSISRWKLGSFAR